MTKLPTTPESEFLGKVTVRLMLPEERERFDQLFEEKHYLQSARLGGQSLRYVAELVGQWLALIAFSGGRSAHQSSRAENPMDTASACPAAVLCGQQ